MFALTSELKFHLYNQATDMRKGFDGLSGLITNELELNPCNGDVFIFINKPRNKIKLLHWQGVGFTMYYRRLERGTFDIPIYDDQVGSIQLDYVQLIMLVDGLSVKNVPKRKEVVV
jgi:transposase